MFSKTVAVLLAPGFEELEALTPVDVFRRAGLTVATAAVATRGERLVPGARQVPVMADCTLEQLNPSEIGLVYLPGGLPGATHLAASAAVHELARTVLSKGGWLAAICAAPIALDAAGLLANVDYTCFPSVEQQINAGRYTGRRVEICGHVLTACGPGASLEFAIAILGQLGMAAKAASIARAMQMPSN